MQSWTWQKNQEPPVSGDGAGGVDMTCENCKYDDLTFYDSPCNVCCCNPSMSGTFGSRMNFFTPIRKHECSNGAGGVKSLEVTEIDVRFGILER